MVRRRTAYIVRFAGIHIVFMAELLVAADNRCVLCSNDALQSLHELTKDCNACFGRQDEWSCAIVSMAPDRWTKSHWADAFDGEVVALLHDGDSVFLEVNGMR